MSELESIVNNIIEIEKILSASNQCMTIQAGGKTDFLPQKGIIEVEKTYNNQPVKKDRMLPYWLYLIFLRYKERFVFRAICNTHVGQSGIGKNELRNLQVFFGPIDEQDKIIFILSKVIELIQKADQVIKQTQKLKKGIMQRLLTRGIGHTEFKKTVIGEIPQEWEIIRISEISKIRRGASPRPIADPTYFGNGRGWIRISDVRQNRGSSL